MPATFASITHTQAPTHDGISFLPTLLDKKENADNRPLYWEFYENGYKQAVRKGQWKAIRFYKGKLPVHTELYDLKTDIGEKNNLAIQYPEIVKEMEAAMDAAHIPSNNPLFQIK